MITCSPAIVKFTENLALETARHDVAVFSVHPGLLPVGMSEQAYADTAPAESSEAHVYAWVRREIDEGRGLVERALRMRHIGPYQLQAAIAAVHADARRSGEIDWDQIAGLYDELLRLEPSPVVELNRAVAIALAGRLDDGLALVDDLAASGRLDGYHLLPAARAELLRRLGRTVEAADAFRAAIALTSNAREVAFLERRLSALA